MVKAQRVNRPIKKTEHTIVVASSAAEKGWRDLLATHRNLLVAAWDFLTAHPQKVTPTNYPLKGSLATVTRDGVEHDRWQHKLSIGNGARIWFYVDQQTVFLERVSTAHPKETE